MKLNWKSYGEGQVLLILHGLFGSETNWQSLAPQLAEGRRVIVCDLRNHGKSDWADSMTFEEMAEDVHELVHELGLEKVTILGHSLGGKVAMTFALDYPNHTENLIVVDATFKAHRPVHVEIARGLVDLNLDQLKSRQEADQLLTKNIPDRATRQFILKNLVQKEGRFFWQNNIRAIQKNYDTQIVAAVETDQKLFSGPVLFIKGGKSDYIEYNICEQAVHFFPHSQLQIIENAGHWLHTESPQEFVNVVKDFLSISHKSST